MNKLGWLKIVLAGFVLASFLPAAQPVAARAPLPPLDRNALYVPGEVVVSFPEGRLTATYQGEASALAGEVRAQVVFQTENMAVLSVDPAADVPALAQRLVASGQVARAQPNYVYWFPESGERPVVKAAAAPPYIVRDQQGNTRSLTAAQLLSMRTRIRQGTRTLSIPSFPKEFTSDRFNVWGWDEIEAEVVWRNASTSPAVCVVDSGVDARHPDLLNRVVNGYDFINLDAIPNDDNGHGTHVAGIISAAMNNVSTSALGVSNGKVVAVKSMNAQGFGTTATLAAGLRFCAARSDVRVINLSLGGSTADPLVYDALLVAIRNNNKLVVAAAGNGSLYGAASAPVYPAAWASASAKDPAGGANQLYSGLVSVAAGRSTPLITHAWVDLNRNNSIDKPEEYFDAQDCGTDFTSFGQYVDLVAPGDTIYSTQPTSYPFFRNYYYGYQARYDYDSGTSMAAPFAAGAAARALSINPALPAYADNPAVKTLKKQLTGTGRHLVYAIEPHPAGDGFDPSDPYKNPAFGYGTFRADPDNPGEWAEKLPFCWPSADSAKLTRQPAVPPGSNPYGAAQEMGGARFLNVAAAMDRVAFYAEVTDASTGLPLAGAQVQARNQNYGSLIDTSVVGSSSPGVFLLNVPIPETGDRVYELYVYKPGYTSGWQYIDSPYITWNPPYFDPARDDPYGGVYIYPYSTPAIPPAKDVTVVLDWNRLVDANLDLYLWLPEDSEAKGVVHPGDFKNYLPAYPAKDFEEGTTLSPLDYTGSLDAISPYARVMHDGGAAELAQDILTFDAITIRRKPNTTQVLPFYTRPDIQKPYSVYVTDYSGSYGGSVGSAPNRLDPNLVQTFAYPIVRIWYKGRIDYNNQWNFVALSAPVNGNYGSQKCAGTASDWWQVAILKGDPLKGLDVTLQDTCGSAHNSPDGVFGILPYPKTAP